jgi:hypothetical protein
LLCVQSYFFSGLFIEAPKFGSSVTVAPRVSRFSHTWIFAGNATSRHLGGTAARTVTALQLNIRQSRPTYP